MREDHPKIPFNHFMKELHKAMALIIKFRGKKDLDEKEIITHIRDKAKSSRPWALILMGYQNHNHDFSWLEKWCYNCLKIASIK
jgi:hypothetical protein